MKPQKRFYGSYAREKIIDALLLLMQCHGFHEITVLMITQEAGVARRTFYLYYQTKEDVLTDYYNVLTREYDAGLEALSDAVDSGANAAGAHAAGAHAAGAHAAGANASGERDSGANALDLKQQAVYFFTFWHRYREYLLLLYKQGLFQLLISSFNNYLVRTDGSVSGDHLAAQRAAFYAGGLWALLYSWTAGGFMETPEELAEVAGAFSGPVGVNGVNGDGSQ